MSTTIDYRPSPDSLAAQVVSFFALNPEEELGLFDIAEKYSPTGNIHAHLAAACNAGLLVWDSELAVYRKGVRAMPSVRPEPLARATTTNTAKPAELPQHTESTATLTPASLRQPWPQPKDGQPMPARKTTPAKKPAGGRIRLDLIKIEEGIPIPAPGAEYQDFLRRFRPMQSAALPGGAVVKLRTAVKALKGDGLEFVIRTQADGQVRVWRTA